MNWLVDHAREPERLESECDLVRAGDAVGSVHGTGGDGKEDLLDRIGADVRCVRVVGAVLGVVHAAHLRQVDRSLQNATTLSRRREDSVGSSGILRGK